MWPTRPETARRIDEYKRKGGIVAHAGDHRDTGAEPGRGNCLVAPLATAQADEILAEYRLSGCWQPPDSDHKVRVEAPQDSYRPHRASTGFIPGQGCRRTGR